MESDLVGITNESQISWFGFSALSFSDCVYNSYVDAWQEVCTQEFKTSLKQLSDKDRLGLLAFPFLHKSTEKMFKVIQRFCVTDIFHIPSSVTLPECKQMLLASNKIEKSQTKSEREFAEKLEKIRVLRIKLAQRKNEIAKVNEAIEVLHVMEKGQEQLIRKDEIYCVSPIQKMSPV